MSDITRLATEAWASTPGKTMLERAARRMSWVRTGSQDGWQSYVTLAAACFFSLHEPPRRLSRELKALGIPMKVWRPAVMCITAEKPEP